MRYGVVRVTISQEDSESSRALMGIVSRSGKGEKERVGTRSPGYLRSLYLSSNSVY